MTLHDCLRDATLDDHARGIFGIALTPDMKGRLAVVGFPDSGTRESVAFTRMPEALASYRPSS
jgi:hypothetical protein